MPVDMQRWAKVATAQVKMGIDPKEKERRARERDINLDLELSSWYRRKHESATARNLDFDLLYSDFRVLMTTPTCAYTGVTFAEGDLGRTLERVNPAIGYTPDNTVAVTRISNSVKSALDSFVKSKDIPDEMKLKLLRKAAYQLEKSIKAKG